MCGFSIVLKDPETGTILGYRKNLVVRTGREFNLRKIFGMSYNSETITQLNNRTINLFSIGKGGSAASDPFSPLPVTATDQNMNTEVAFRSINLLCKELSGYEIDSAGYVLKISSKKVGLLDMKKIDYLYNL